MITAQIKEQGYNLVIQSLQTLPDRLREASATGLARGLLFAVGISQREYLQGPRPQFLGEVTARLRNSIASSVKTTDRTVTGRIGTNVKYAAFHEFGFHGTQQVRGFNRVFSRTTGLGEVIGGRAASGRFLATGGRKEAKKQKAGAVAFEFIRPHTRQVDYAGRPFVSPALQRAQPLIIQAITEDMAAVKP